MRINKGTYLFILLLLAFTAGKAQMPISSYNMSPIVSSSKTMTSNGGNPILMSGKGKCLTVSSGLSTLQVDNNNTGSFGASCVETAPVATVLVELTAINLYPNPTHSTSILKCQGQFDANLSCQVRVTSIDGKTMYSQMVQMKDVQAGYTINANAYAAGTYVVTIDFMNQRYSKMLIKL